MTEFLSFSEAERELLASLPYRVGMWMSYADDEEGERDDEREVAALEQCIKAIAGLHQDKPFVSAVLQETLAQKSKWVIWAEAGIFSVSRQVEEVVALLANNAQEGEVKNYRAALMEIATTVAQAYGEFGSFNEGGEEERSGFFGKVVSKIVNRFSALSEEDADHPMNVSAAEDSALAELARVLKV